MKTPAILPDGSCSDCLGGWLCTYHQQQSLKADQRRSLAFKLAARALRQAEIDRLCARLELESDEFSTADQKAVAILNR